MDDSSPQVIPAMDRPRRIQADLGHSDDASDDDDNNDLEFRRL